MPKKTSVSKTGVVHLRRKWSEAAPKTKKERQALLEKCGSGCFLQPEKLKYPICPKGTCKVSKKGADAARSRSAQYHRRKIEKKAKAVQQRIKRATK